MITKWKMIVGIVLAVFLLQPAILNVAAQPTHDPGMPGTTTPTMPTMPHTPPHMEQREDGSIFISTDIIAVMANSQTPQFHFWFAADNNGTIAKFSLIYLSLVEFEDSNGDGAFQSNETLYYAPLAAYDWTLLSGSVELEGQTVEVWLKYIKGGLRDGGMMPNMPHVDPRGQSAVERFKDVTLQIWAHIYLEDYNGTVSDEHGVKANYLVAGSSELKMDIEIGNFPFSTNTSRVALQTLLRENEAAGPQNRYRHRFQVRERIGNFSCNSANDWDRTPGNETPFHDMRGTPTQRIDFYDSISGVAQGFYSWLNVATVIWPGGTTEVVNVTASYVPTGVGLAVYLAYPNFDDGTLLHDPSIGVYPEATPEITIFPDAALFIGIGIVALVAIGVVILRRK